MIANIFIALTGVLHLVFMYLEMVLWAKPQGLRIFGMSREQAESSKTLAANQGLYNGCLAVSLFATFVTTEEAARPMQLVLLAFVVTVGVYGAATVSRKIFFVQALPALLAIAALLIHV